MHGKIKKTAFKHPISKHINHGLSNDYCIHKKWIKCYYTFMRVKANLMITPNRKIQAQN